MAHSTASAANEMAADELEEAWEAVTEAWRHAMNLLRDDAAYGRLDAYASQVFDPDSRMVGMQSVNQWVVDAVSALRGDDEAGADDEYSTCACGLYPAGEHGCQ